MATHNYTAAGGFDLVGCVEVDTSINVITAYDVGDLLYIVHRAKLGKLEKVAIKKINVINHLIYNYQDTFNRVWFEDELCELEAAEILVQRFKDRQSAAYVRYLRNCQSVID